ncbi:MAG: hypothetical protein AAF961_02515 [Planctomycetota bacterium]
MPNIEVCRCFASREELRSELGEMDRRQDGVYQRHPRGRTGQMSGPLHGGDRPKAHLADERDGRRAPIWWSETQS